MRLSIVVAVALNGAIGRNNELPWRLPADLKIFRRITEGHTVVMGRKTAESIGKPLPNRRNVVMSRQPEWSLEGFAEIYPSLDACLAALRDLSDLSEEVFIIGGATLFEVSLQRDIIHRMYWTEVQAKPEADVFFPQVDWSHWQLVHEEAHTADERNAFAFVHRVYERITVA